MAVKLAVVGFGHACRERSASTLVSLAAEGAVELSAMVEADAGRREQAMQALGFKQAFASVGECIEQARPDAALVLTAATHHFEPTMQLLQAGVATCVEKPICYSVRQAREVCDAARDSGTICMVMVNRCFMPVMVRAKEFLGDAPVEFVFAEKSKKIPTTYKALLDDGVHPWSALVHFAGLPTEVLSTALDEGNSFAAMVKLPSGGTGVFLESCHPGGWTERYEVHAGGKSVYIDDCVRLRLYEGGKEVIGDPLANSWWNTDPYGFGAEIREFVGCVQEGRRSEIADIGLCVAAQERLHEVLTAVGLELQEG